MMMRVHGTTIAEAGLIIGGGLLTLGAIGMLAMGSLTDWLARRGHRDAPYIAGTINGIALFGCATVASLCEDHRTMVVAVLAYTLFGGTWVGVASAALQLITPAPLRGRMSALYLVVVNILGLGLGPLAVGLATDHLFGNDLAIGKSIILVGAVAVSLSTGFFLWGRKAYIIASQR